MKEKSYWLEAYGYCIETQIRSTPSLSTYSLSRIEDQDKASKLKLLCQVTPMRLEKKVQPILSLLEDSDFPGPSLVNSFIAEDHRFTITDCLEGSLEKVGSDAAKNERELIKFHIQLVKLCENLLEKGVFLEYLTPSSIFLAHTSGDELAVGIDPWITLRNRKNLHAMTYQAPDSLYTENRLANTQHISSLIYSTAAVIARVFGKPSENTQSSQLESSNKSNLEKRADDLLQAALPPPTRLEILIGENYRRIIERSLRVLAKQQYHSFTSLLFDLNKAYDYNASRKEEFFSLGLKDKYHDLSWPIELIGRNKPIDRLWSAFNLARDGMGSLYTLRASEGIGKSSLLNFFANRIKKSIKSETVVFDFDNKSGEVPYLAIVSTLEGYFTSLLKTFDFKEKCAWKNKLKSLSGAHGIHLPRLLPVLINEFPEDFRDVAENVEEEGTEIGALTALIMCLQITTKTNLIIFENIHFADKASLYLLQHINQLSREARLGNTLFVATYSDSGIFNNSDLRTIFLEKTQFKNEINLERLDKEESDRLVVQWLGYKDVEWLGQLQTNIFGRAKGNPQHTILLLQRITSHHFQIEENGRIQFNPIKLFGDTSLDSIDRLYAEKLNELTALGRSLIEILSSTGEHDQGFLAKCLHHLHAGDEHAFSDDPNLLLTRAWNELLGFFPYQSYRRRLVLDNKLRKIVNAKLLDHKKRRINRFYLKHLIKLIGPDPEKASTVYLFTASKYIDLTDNEIDRAIAGKIHMACARRCESLVALNLARSHLEEVCRVIPIHLASSAKNSFHLDRSEILSIHEKYADLLSTTEKIDESLECYDQLLKYTNDVSIISRILQKTANLFLTRYEYERSLTASERSLEILGYKLYKSQTIALIALPFLIVKVILYSLFSSILPKKKVSTEDESVLNIVLKSLIPTYLTKPICTFANIGTLYCRMAFVDTNKHQAMLQAYLGSIVGSFGFFDLGKNLIERSRRFFSDHSDPHFAVFVDFCQGYMVDFPAGRFEEALAKLDSANQKAINNGEIFWRTLCYQCRIEMHSYYGKLDERRDVVELIEGRKRINFGSIVFQACFQYWHQTCQQDLLEHYQKLCAEHYRSGLKQDHLTLDLVYYLVSQAEIEKSSQDFEMALTYLKQANKISLRFLHYAGKVRQAIMLMCEILVQRNQLFKAIPYIFMAFIYGLFGHRLIQPKLVSVIGMYFIQLKIPFLGLLIMERSLRFALRRRQYMTANDIRVCLGKAYLETNRNSELAATHLYCAERFYKRMGYKKAYEKCINLLAKLTQQATDFPEFIDDNRSADQILSARLKILQSPTKNELFQRLIESIDEIFPLHKAFIISRTEEHDNRFEFAKNNEPDVSSFILKSSDFFRDYAYRFVHPILFKTWIVDRNRLDHHEFQSIDSECIVKLKGIDDTQYLVYLHAKKAIEEHRLNQLHSTLIQDSKTRLDELIVAYNLKQYRSKLQLERESLKAQIVELDTLRDSLAATNATLCFSFGDYGFFASKPPKKSEEFFPDIFESNSIYDCLKIEADQRYKLEQFFTYCIGTDPINFLANSHLLPAEHKVFHKTLSERSFVIQWFPLVQNTVVFAICSVFTDITDHRLQQSTIQSLRQGHKQIEDLCLVNQNFFQTFLEEALYLCEEIKKLSRIPETQNSNSRISCFLDLLYEDARCCGLINLSQVILSITKDYSMTRSDNLVSGVEKIKNWLKSYGRLYQLYRGVLIDFEQTKFEKSTEVLAKFYELKQEKLSPKGLSNIHYIEDFVREKRFGSTKRVIYEICQAEKNSEHIEIIIDSETRVQNLLDLMKRTELIVMKTAGRLVLKMMKQTTMTVTIRIGCEENTLWFLFGPASDNKDISKLSFADLKSASDNKAKKIVQTQYYARLIDLVEVLHKDQVTLLNYIEDQKNHLFFGFSFKMPKPATEPFKITDLAN